MRALVDRQVRMWSEVAREARIELD
jgi:hypothetical protein